MAVSTGTTRVSAYVVCCRMCGYELFDDNAVIHRNDACTSIFVAEPPAWIWALAESDKAANAGRMTCPNVKCRKKLGHWSWSGSQCSCLEWIAPAFQFLRSHVDPKPVAVV